MGSLRFASLLMFVACAAAAKPRCEDRGRPVASAPKKARTSTGPEVAVGEHVVAFRSLNGRLLVRRLDDGAVRFNANAPGEVLFVDDTKVLLLRMSGKLTKLVEVTFPEGAERETQLPAPAWAFRKPEGRWMHEEHTIDVWPTDAGWVMSWSSTIPPGPTGIPPPPEATIFDCGSFLVSDGGVKAGGFITVPEASWTGDGLTLDDGAVLRSIGERDVLQEADGGVVVLADRSKQRLGQGTYSIRVGYVAGAWVRGNRVVIQSQHDDGGRTVSVLNRDNGRSIMSGALPTPPVEEPMPPLP